MWWALNGRFDGSMGDAARHGLSWNGHEQSVKGLVMKIKDLQHVFTNLHLSLVISNSMIIN